MRKLVYSDSNENLTKAAEQMATLIESERHIKSASSSAISEQLIRHNLPDKDHFACHLIAMGAGEIYSHNRNGDFFPEEMLKRSHHTFVTNGHLFREHRNTDPKLAIGHIKASAYNDNMHRVELIVHGHKKKAEAEYESIKKGEPRAYSMSVSVPYDICSCCNHKAAKTAFYCEDLKKHMNQYRPKFRKFAYAINERGTFFDISDVKNNADRIAHFLEYRLPENEQMDKAASTNGVEFSEQLATAAGVCVPDGYDFGFQDTRHIDTLRKLAHAEQLLADSITSSEPWALFAKTASAHSFHADTFTEADLVRLKEIPLETVLVQMAKRAAVLPFQVFIAFTGDMTLKAASEDPVVQKAQAGLSTMFRQSLGSVDAEMENLLTPDMDKSSAYISETDGRFFDRIAKQAFTAHLPEFRNRALMNSTRPVVEPVVVKSASLSAAEDERAHRLVQIYGIYKVAATAAICDSAVFPVDAATLIVVTSLS